MKGEGEKRRENYKEGEVGVEVVEKGGGREGGETEEKESERERSIVHVQ